MTAPHTHKGSGWYTFGVLFAAAFSLALIVDQALIVAAGRHLVARVDAWLAGLQPAPTRIAVVDLMPKATPDKGAAATTDFTEYPSEFNPETPEA